MEDFGTAAATKAALLLIIGEPVTEDHKHLIPEELAKGKEFIKITEKNVYFMGDGRIIGVLFFAPL